MVDEMELKDLLKWLFQFHTRMPLLLLLLIFVSLASPCSAADKETSAEAVKTSRYGIAAVNFLSSGLEYLDTTLQENAGTETARTFGRPIKRLQGMLLPVMFKLGVLSTIIFMTFLLALKAVIIGSILLTLQVFGAIAKLGFLLKFKGHGDHDHHYHQPAPSIQYWAPPAYPATGHAAVQKEVHLHVHTNSSPHPQSSHHEYSPPAPSYGIPHESWGRSDISLNHPVPPVQVSWSPSTSFGQYFKSSDSSGPVYYSFG